MTQVWAILQQMLEQHGSAALVSVREVLGSAPREVGARMVVAPDGGFRGTIGGGALEWRALAEAQRVLKNGGNRLDLRRHALGPELGQCCGGSVRLLVEVFDQDRINEVAALAAAEKAGPFTTCSELQDDRVSRTVIAAAPGPEHAGDLLETFGEVRRPLYLFGAGHVGKALMLALAPLPFDVIWVDSRREAFPPVAPGNVEIRHSPDPAKELERAPAGSFVIALTHSHAQDFDIVAVALKAGHFDYVGVIGSATKRARFVRRLRDGGQAAEAIDSLICPIGIGEITSKQPVSIAAAVVAELLIRDEQVKAAQAGSQSDAPKMQRSNG